MRSKLSTRLVRGLMSLLLGGAIALGLIAVPALAGTSTAAPTSTAPGVTTPAGAPAPPTLAPRLSSKGRSVRCTARCCT